MRVRSLPTLAIGAVVVLLALFVAVPVTPAAAAIPTETDTSATTIHVDLANNRVDGAGWASGQLLVEVWSGPGASTPLRSATPAADAGGSFSHSFGQVWEGGFDITSGMVVSVTQGSVTKVMSDTNLRIDQWDPTTDHIWGSGAIGPVQVCAVSGWLPYPAEQTDPAREGCAFGLPYDPATGAWSWDFMAEQQYDPAVTWQVDLLPYLTHVQAGQWDANGDGMGSDGQNVPWPHLSAPAGGAGPIDALGYPEGTEVELTVDLPGTPDPTPAYVQAVFDPQQGTTVAHFTQFGNVPMNTVLRSSGQRPADLAGDGPVVRQLVIRPIGIDVHLADDTIGIGSFPNADLEVQANEPGGGRQMHVRADPTGGSLVDVSGQLDLTPAGSVSVRAYDTPDDHDLDVLYAGQLNQPPTIQTIFASPTTDLSDRQPVHVSGDGFTPDASVGIAETYGAPDPSRATVLASLPTDGQGHYEGTVIVGRYVNGLDMYGQSARLTAFDPGDPFNRNASTPISFLPPIGPITLTVDPAGTVTTGGWATITGTITCGADMPATLSVEVWEPIGRKSVATGTATIEVKPCWAGQTVRWTAVVKPGGTPLVPFGNGTAQVQVRATQDRYGDHSETTVTPPVRLVVKTTKPPRR